MAHLKGNVLFTAAIVIDCSFLFNDTFQGKINHKVVCFVWGKRLTSMGRKAPSITDTNTLTKVLHNIKVNACLLQSLQQRWYHIMFILIHKIVQI